MIDRDNSKNMNLFIWIPIIAITWNHFILLYSVGFWWISYSIHLPNTNIIDFIAKIITPIPKIDPKNTDITHKIFAKICPNTIKRTTANLICIVCHTLCFRDWDIHQANVFFSFFCQWNTYSTYILSL